MAAPGPFRGSFHLVVALLLVGSLGHGVVQALPKPLLPTLAAPANKACRPLDVRAAAYGNVCMCFCHVCLRGCLGPSRDWAWIAHLAALRFAGASRPYGRPHVPTSLVAHRQVRVRVQGGGSIECMGDTIDDVL